MSLFIFCSNCQCALELSNGDAALINSNSKIKIYPFIGKRVEIVCRNCEEKIEIYI